MHCIINKRSYLNESGIKFKDESFKVVEEDPLIFWHFPYVGKGEKIDISYIINKKILEECAKLLNGLGIAENIVITEKPASKIIAGKH